MHRAPRETDPDPVDVVAIEVGEAADGVVIAVRAVAAATIVLVLEIVRRATKPVQLSRRQAPAAPPVPRVVSASDRRGRVEANEHTTTEVHAAKIDRAVDAVAIVKSDHERNRVAPHRRLKAWLQRPGRPKNLGISVSASLK